MTNKECEWCDEELDEEEVENPSKSEDGEIICDECYDEEYRQICPICEEFFEKARKVEDKLTYMVVSKRVGRDVIGKDLKRGIYLITEFPFFADGIIEGHYYSDSFKRLRDLTKEERERIKEEYLKDEEVCHKCATERGASPILANPIKLTL